MFYFVFSDYAEPSEIGFTPPLDSPTNFENKSYMTALRGDLNINPPNNNNKNYVNFPSNQHNGGEFTKERDNSATRPILTSNNDYEQILYEKPNNEGGDPTENYEQLEQSDIPQYHTINVASPENRDDLYEPMIPKLGTV